MRPHRFRVRADRVGPRSPDELQEKTEKADITLKPLPLFNPLGPDLQGPCCDVPDVRFWKTQLRCCHTNIVWREVIIC